MYTSTQAIRLIAANAAIGCLIACLVKLLTL